MKVCEYPDSHVNGSVQSPFKVRDAATLRFTPAGDFDGHDGRTRLLAVVKLSACHFHLEAIEVRENENGEQVAVNDAFDSSLYAMGEIAGEGAFDTVEIEGRTYVLNMIPFCK